VWIHLRGGCVVPNDRGESLAMHRSSLVIRIETPYSSFVYSALKPEEGVLPGKRSKATLGLGDACLTINIESEDTTALRAAANSFIRWCSAILRCLEVEEGKR